MPTSVMNARPQARRKIFQLGELCLGDRSLRVHLLDVSEGGARLHCPTVLSVGTAVTLCWQQEHWRAVVVWAGSNKCGVRFIAPLALSSIEALTAPL